MDRKTIAYVKKQLRKASLANPSRISAKNKSKVDKALFECNHCGCYCYEGVSDKNMKELEKKYPSVEIKKEKVQADHIVPVREGKGEFDWGDYIESMFCSEDNYQMLCDECHSKKSKKDKDENANKKV